MSDRGAKALAELAYMDRPPVGPRPIPQTPVVRKAWEAWTHRILGTTGLFIADATKHEPIIDYGYEEFRCKCGYDFGEAPADESYFDHIGATE